MDIDFFFYFILRPRRCYVTKLSLNLEKQFTHQSGKTHHLCIHEHELDGQQLPFLNSSLLKATPKDEINLEKIWA